MSKNKKKMEIKIDDYFVIIPCIYNSGRKASVRTNLNEPNIIYINIDDEKDRPYQFTDGYLHINPQEVESSQAYQSVENCKKAIDMINKHFFAGSLLVLSDDKAIVQRNIPRQRAWIEWVLDIYNAFFDDGNKLFRSYFKIRKLTIKDRILNAVSAAKQQYQTIEVVENLSKAHLGGSWQNYSDVDWLKEAEKMSESKIYLA